MGLTDLRVLEAVARHGSMNRAAAELCTVQSNVSGRIRVLEEQLGATPFERQSRGIRSPGARHGGHKEPPDYGKL